MIDDKTRTRFAACQQAARSQGRDLATVLDENKLLLTPGQFSFIQAAGVEELMEILENQPVSVLTRGAENPADAARAVLDAIRLFYGSIR